jgi:hypothetical protein
MATREAEDRPAEDEKRDAGPSQESTVQTQTASTGDEDRFSTVPLTAQSNEWTQKEDTEESSPGHRRNISQSSTLAIRVNSPIPAHTNGDAIDDSEPPPLFAKSARESGISLTSIELQSPLQKRFSDLQLQRASQPRDSEDIDWGALSSTSLAQLNSLQISGAL